MREIELFKGHIECAKDDQAFQAKIGRAVLKGEEVHHVDMNTLNNHPENLILCKSHAEHMMYHHG